MLDLFPSGTDHDATPIWSEVTAEQLRFAPKQVVVETRPSGALVPRRHVLPFQTWDITMARVWAVALGSGLTQTDGQPDTGRYTLVVTFMTPGQPEAVARTYAIHTYSGVTLEAADTSDKDKCDFLTNYTFAAESRAVLSGVGCPV